MNKLTPAQIGRLADHVKTAVGAYPVDSVDEETSQKTRAEMEFEDLVDADPNLDFHYDTLVEHAPSLVDALFDYYSAK
jgi:hypothetical protein